MLLNRPQYEIARGTAMFEVVAGPSAYNETPQTHNEYET